MSSPAHAPAPVRHAVWLVLGLVLLVGVACSSPSASENPPSEPSAAPTRPSEAPAVDDGQEWIVFQGAPLGLSLIQPDGSGNHVILGPPGDQLHADWSPDGSQIAYVQGRDGRSADLDYRPTGHEPATAGVDWHPTDDLIVFCTNDVGGLQVTDEPSNLFTVRSDGSKLSQITDYGPGKERASQPTWTADGRIIFDHITGANDERGTVAFIKSDGSGLEIAVGNEFIGESNRPHPRLRPVVR
jgi:WD40 repeat protein